MARDLPSTGAEAFMFPSISNMIPQMSSSTTNNNPWLMFPFPITTLFPLFWEPAATVPTGVGQSLPGSASLLCQVKEEARPSRNGNKTPMIQGILWRRASLQSMAAAPPAILLATSQPQVFQREGKEMEQLVQQTYTVCMQDQ